MSRIRKAAVAAVGAVVTILAAFDVPVAEDVSEAVIALVTAALVYLVPND